MLLAGVPKLQALCVGILIEFRDCLEDVGDTPIELLQPVLLRCNSEQLASIEDATREGGRELHDDLQAHWHRVFLADFGGWFDACIKDMHESSSSCHTSRNTRNWRQLYEIGQTQLRQKTAGLGKRLRAMTQAEVQSRQTKHVEIIEAPRPLKRTRTAKGSNNPKQQLQIIPARQRVLSKLGLLHSSKLKHLIHIRPPKRAATADVTLSSHHQPRSAAKSGGDAQRRSPHQLVKQRTLSKPVVSQPLPDIRQRLSKQPSSTARLPFSQSDAAPQASNPARHQFAGLVEDDIDWMANSQVGTSAAEAVPDPDHSWTVQYLEAPGNAEGAACTTGKHPSINHKNGSAQNFKSSDSMHDLAPVKHGTNALIEADIKWD